MPPDGTLDTPLFILCKKYDQVPLRATACVGMRLSSLALGPQIVAKTLCRIPELWASVLTSSFVAATGRASGSGAPSCSCNVLPTVQLAVHKVCFFISACLVKFDFADFFSEAYFFRSHFSFL